MDPYEVLGVSRTAPDSVIKAAFRARIRETHPDAGGDPADAQQVNDAYATLTDPARRAQVPPLTSEPAPPEPSDTPTGPAWPRHEPSARTETPVDPHLVFTHDRDLRPLWKRRAAWIPVAVAIAIGAGANGPLGAVAALAAAAVLLLRWSPKVIAAAYLVIAAPLLISAGISGDVPTLTDLFPTAIAVAAFTPVLLVWAAIKRRIRRTEDAHAADIFATTRDQFALDELVAFDLHVGAAGQRLARMASVDGFDRGTYVLAPSSFPIDVGDHVLMHHQQPLYAVPARVLR